MHAILDDGSTDHIFPSNCKHLLHSIKNKSGSITFGNSGNLKYSCTGSYGALKGVLLCKGVRLPLISISKLTKINKYKIIHSDDRAFVLKEYNPRTDDLPPDWSINKSNYRAIASATVNGGLFQIDDISRFEDPSLYQAYAHGPAETKAIVDDDEIEEPQIPPRPPEQPQVESQEDSDMDAPAKPLDTASMKGKNKRVMIKSARQYVNYLEWLHVKMGHLGEEVIKWIVKKSVVNGTGVSWEVLSKQQMGICDACLHARMHALPIYPSMSKIKWGIFECLTSDYISYGFTTRRMFTGCYIFQDLGSDKPFVVQVKTKTAWLWSLKRVIREFGPGRNSRSLSLKVFKTDFDTVVHSGKFTRFLTNENIQLQNSAPYKHQQNPMERTIQSVWNMVRCSMYYNKAPKSFLCSAVDYAVDTYGFLCSIGETQSRDEVFWGRKTDVSKCVPFYASGWYNVTPEEMQYLQSKQTGRIKDKARNCIFIGYSEPFRLENVTQAAVYVKDSYIVYIPDSKAVTVRKDCFFKGYPDDLTSIIHSDKKMRRTEPDSDTELEESQYEEVETYDQMITRSKAERNALIKTKWEESNPSANFKPYWSDADDLAHWDDKDEAPELTEEDSDSDVDEEEFIPNNTKKNNLAAKSFLEEITDKFGSTQPLPSMWDMLKKNYNSNNQPDKPPIPYAEMKISDLEYTPEVAAEVARIEKADRDGTTLPATTPNIGNTPNNFLQALQSPNGSYWLKAWKTEISRLDDRHLLLIEPQYDGPEASDPDRPMKSKAAFRESIKPDGDFKFRSRMVGCGYSQIPGRDFDENYSPTVKYESLCIILHLAAVFDWEIIGIDVENAFIEPDIDRELHMYLPKDIYAQSGRRVKSLLLKSIYGTKQAGTLWYAFVDDKLVHLGYTRSCHDICVYIYSSTDGKIFIICLVYVDDLLFVGSKASLATIHEHIDYFESQLTKLTTETNVTRYIGVDIKRDRKNHTITLSQKPYQMEYVKQNVPGDAPSKPLPLPYQVDYNEQEGTEEPIQKQVGQLRFLADRTKMEIQAAVGILGSAAAHPSKEHVKGTVLIGQYLKGTLDDGLKLGGMDINIKPFAYSDANYDPRYRSRLASIWFLNHESGAFSGQSILDPNIRHSSCGTEADALDVTTRKAEYLRGFFAELGFPQLEPTVIYTDSKSAKQLIELFHVGSNSAHLVMRLNYLHEQTQRKNIVLKYINTDDNVADIQTKLLAIPKFEKFKDIMLHGHGGITPLAKTLIVPEPNRSKVMRNILKHKLKVSKGIINK